MNKNSLSVFFVFIIICLVFTFLFQKKIFNENLLENKNLKIEKEKQELKIKKINESKLEFDNLRKEYDLSELRQIFIALLDKNKISNYSLKNNSDEIIINFLSEKNDLLSILNELENLEYVPKITEAQLKNNKFIQVNFKISKDSFKFADKSFFKNKDQKKEIVSKNKKEKSKIDEEVLINHNVDLISKIEEKDSLFFYWIKDENFCIKKLVPEKILLENENEIIVISNCDKYSIRKN